MPETKTPPRAQPREDHGIRSMTLRMASVNMEDRSIEAVIATERPTLVLDQATMRPVEEVLIMSGAELPDQMVMLDTHSKFSIEEVRGSIRNLRVEGAEMIGRLFFAEDEVSERGWQKVSHGHIRDVSVGVKSMETTIVPPFSTRTVAGREFTAGAKAIHVRTKWRPREGSLVPIGADPSATTRTDTESHTLRGDTLAGVLNGLIDDQAGENRPRSEIVEELGEAAGIDSGTVNQILNSGIDCPPRDRLEGFASVLDVTTEQLIDAAEDDGCTY